MTYRGHIENGRVLLNEPVQLPEGAQVTIEVVAGKIVDAGRQRVHARRFQPIEMPGGSLADEIVRERR